MPSFFYHIFLDLCPPTTPVLSDASRHSSQLPEQVNPKHFDTLVTTNEAKHTRNLLGLPSGQVETEVIARSNASEPIGPTRSIREDWRYDRIKIQNIDMVSGSKRGSHEEPAGRIANSIVAGHGGLANKGRFEPLNHDEEDIGWGVIRLFRDAEQTPGLYDDAIPSKSKGYKGSTRKGDGEEAHFRDEDCNTLCILAVPSYLTPSDFLGFVGEKTRDEVSHFRMVRTERGNRYMVLMKFRNGKRAKVWRKEWNGKPFDSMEPESCHVVFIKSIEFLTPNVATHESFPDMSNDPFTPLQMKPDSQASTAAAATSSALSSATRSTKPMAPPTPSLVELPTCPVCLERMDESTGLLTILCQHVFHCTCLQKWRGSGCPVCRYTQDGLSKRRSMTGEETGLNECSICRSDANLWICLVCGNVGCGRYDAAHAFFHYQQTSHSFAMDLSTQRVWDYATDAYVHRLVQDKADGKLMELPANAPDTHGSTDEGDAWDQEDYVPREKLDNIGREYTHLLTSQLESQRTYFSEALQRAADKASQASQAAESAQTAASKVQEQLAALQVSHEELAKQTVPALERDKDRASKRADRFEVMARKLEKEWREEKAVSGSLMEKIRWLEERMLALTAEKADLEEQNRDLGFFISSGEKLKQLKGVEEEEVREGSTTLPDAPAAGKGKQGKGKGKK
ncbi:MAG: hypothetical protein LQ348_004320 [Seirophora lacunosa]|nr:MAG: hypothetical protein LQ348_004320 [Seirophora lacunosa]